MRPHYFLQISYGITFVGAFASILFFQYPGDSHGDPEYQHYGYNDVKDSWEVIILLGVKAIASNQIEDDVCDAISVSVLQIQVDIKEPD
jgi:hypothetical protein